MDRDFPSVEAVQECDKGELREIDGDYTAIAQRMEEMVNFAWKQIGDKTYVPYEDWCKAIHPVIERYKTQFGQDWDKKEWKRYSDEWARLRASFPQTSLDEKVAVLQVLTTRGMMFMFIVKKQEDY